MLSRLGPFAFGQQEIITLSVFFDREVELLRLEPGRGSHADEPGFLEPWQGEPSFFICFYYIHSISYHHSRQWFVSFVECARLIGVDIDCSSELSV